MSRSVTPQKQSQIRPVGRTWVPATFTLASWQLRSTWRLLLFIGIGILVSVILACVPPLYSEVVTTVGLRDTIMSSIHNSEITVSGQATKVMNPDTEALASAIDNHAQSTIGQYITSPQFSLHTGQMPLLQSAGQPLPDKFLQLTTFVTSDIGNHLHLLHGRLPSTIKDGLEIALTDESAHDLDATVGSTFAIKVVVTAEPIARYEYLVPLHVVGIFSPPDFNAAYWHGDTFLSIPPTDVNNSTVYTALASSTDFVNLLSSYFSTDKAFDPKQFDPRVFTVLETPVHLYWYYSLDPDKVKDSELDTTMADLISFQTSIVNDTQLDRIQFFEQVNVTIPTSSLQQYADETAVAEVPTLSISLIILSLLLYFVSLMANFLTEREATVLAILRSRGASRRQVFGSLLLQSIACAVIGLIAGPFLAVLLVVIISHWLLPAQYLGTLTIITSNILSSVWSVGWYAVAVVGVILLAVIVAINHVTSLDVLAMRREDSRTTLRPLWARLNLDIVSIILMITGFIASSYLINTNVLDTHLQLILLSPLILARTIFMIIGAILIFLRIFPYILRLGSSLALRSRGASSMLALPQMARSPKQALRLTLLLSLATAFSIFASIFYASQAQRAYDVANFTVGSDFMATLAAEDGNRVKKTTAHYRQGYGVLSATVGESMSNAKAGDNLAIASTLLAVDADTFEKTMYWPDNNSTQPLSVLMQKLVQGRGAAIQSRNIPALVDKSLWQSLKLQPGRTFSVTDPTLSDLSLHFTAVAEIQYIPTVTLPGGVLIDFPTFYQVRLALTKAYGTSEYSMLNQLWLRTNDDVKSLTSTRHVLSTRSPAVVSYQDRRVMLDKLHHEPLYLDLVGILALGPGTVLLLALIGNLLASWLNARNRLSGFVLLRALGANSRSIAETLTWEQGIVYTISMVLGVIFGVLLSMTVIPSLLFTSANGVGISDAEFYVSQSIPPIQIIVPAFAGLGLALLVGVCVVALGMMIRTVTRPQMGQALRINSD